MNKERRIIKCVLRQKYDCKVPCFGCPLLPEKDDCVYNKKSRDEGAKRWLKDYPNLVKRFFIALDHDDMGAWLFVTAVVGMIVATITEVLR